jgi:hypothetical protein
LVDVGAGKRVVLIQIEENSATLTPYGSLIRIPRARATAKLRACLLSYFTD